MAHVFKSILYKVFLVPMAAIILSMLVFQTESHGMGSNEVPAIIIVDAVTGEPVEGAVAIAIWHKGSMKTGIFSGGIMVPTRIEEEVSDKNGQIFIEGFWDWHFREYEYPHLTVYKPGYVCWDETYSFYDFNEEDKKRDKLNREQFTEEHPVIKMNKWKKRYSYDTHSRFISDATWPYHGDIYEATEKIFKKAIKYNGLRAIKERNEIRKRKKKTKIKRGKK